MDLLLDRLNAEEGAWNSGFGQNRKRPELRSAFSMQDSLDSSYSACNNAQGGHLHSTVTFERSASVSSVSTSTRVHSTVPFAPQIANIQRGSAGAKRDFAAVKAGEDTPLKRAKEPTTTAQRSRDKCKVVHHSAQYSTGEDSATDELLREGLRSRLDSEVTCSDAPAADCVCTPPGALNSSNSCTDLCCGESDVFSDWKRFPAGQPCPSRDTISVSTALQSKGLAGPGWKPSFELLDTIRALFASEDSSRLDACYMQNHGRHVNPALFIDAPMRAIAVSWLVEVALEFGLHQETLHLATILLDSFLAIARAVPRSKLQLISVACMLIAAKHEEEMHPSIGDFTSIADHCFVESELIHMESLVLQSLKFRVCMPSSHTFLSIFLQICQVSAKTVSMAAYFLELAMLEYHMLRHAPSVIACSALTLAAWTCNDSAGQQRTKHLAETGCQPSTDCLQDMLDLHQQSAIPTMDHSNPQMAVRDKYRDAAWHSISQASPLSQLPNGL